MQDQDIHQSLYEAAIHHQAGRLKEAEKIYLQVLTIAPSNPEANHNLGVLAMQTGKNTEIALPRFQQAWQADPSHQQHWASYIRALVAAGDQATAQEVYADGQRRGLGGPDPSAMQPSTVQGRRNRGPQRDIEDQTDINREIRQITGLLKKQKFPAAERKARTLTERYPRRAEGWKFLGFALRELGRKEDAYNALGAAVQLSLQSSSVDVELWYALGELTYLQNMYRETEVAMQRVLSVEPQNTNASLLLSRALLNLYLPTDAEEVCLAALREKPDSAGLHSALAEALQSQGREDEAVQSFRRALTLNPRDVDAYQALGKILFEKQRYDEILSLCRLTINKAPDFFFAHSDRGTVLQLTGRIEEAMAAYRQALTLKPDDLATRSAWLFCCNYVAAMPAREMHKEAAKYGKFATAQAEAYSSWNCEDSPKKLRVGFVSGDLREHPVGHFLENVLAHSDPERIEWFAYSTVAVTDTLSERLQHRVERWTVLSGMGAKDCAQLIHGDAVHLLLDLSGHTAHNMLPTFAWRPAPVQASWLGYFATTGLAEMDYFIADSVGVPTGERAYFSETVWNLPETRLCFTPPEDAPEVSSTPALSNNYVTFGCFQRLPKITDETLRSWSRILESCKNSRLRIQSEGLHQEPLKSDFLERAALLGIPNTRLELAGKEPRADYLARHAEIDIILDCFPFSGGATTCEALWMGVPTVTLAGATLISRQGASLLSAAGLEDWVAETSENFVELAIEKASDLQALQELRATLREQVLSSPLYDGELFANHLVDALHGMWGAR